MFVEITKVTGLTYDQIKFICTLLICFPLGHIFRVYFNTRRFTPKTRHFISLICGTGLMTFCFGRQAVHLLVSSLLGYVLMLCIDEAVVHRFVFVCAMTYLSIIHINRMFSEVGYVIDISGPLMFATVKITYVGYSIHDAYTLLQQKNEKNKTVRQQYIASKPTLLEYLGYVFNFSSMFCGPPPEFHDYLEFIEEKQYQKYEQTGSNQTPSPLVPAVVKFLLGHLMIACYSMLVPYFLPEYLSDPKRLAKTNFLSNLIFAELVIYLNKAKYYSAFLIGEGACNVSGLGFNGYDKNGSPLWDKLKNVDPLGMEKAQSINDMVQSWNMVTNTWLKKCVYNRVQRMPLLVTWAFSAFWHGFYLGYYMFFVPLGIGLFVSRKLRRKLRPYFLHSPAWKFLYDAMSLIFTRLVINFYAAAFCMLDMVETLKFWRASYHYGHVIIVVGLVLAFVLPDVPKTVDKSSDENQNGLKESVNSRQNGKIHVS